MIDLQAALADMKRFILEAGAMALKNQSSITRLYKDGQQALTETDLAVSRMAQEQLKHWLDLPDHVLIDEESIDQAGTPADVFAHGTYQWVLDPIDGTASYALGRNLWGISLGLMEKGKPLAGVIYLPAIQVLLIADDKVAWHIKHVGQADEQQVMIKPMELPLNSQIFIESYFGPNMNWGDGWYDKIWINRPESAVQGFYSALVGQAVGATSISGYSYWDVAAMTAIAARSGHALRCLEDDELFSAFQVSDFQTNWKMKRNWLLSRAEDYAYLKDALVG